MTDIKLRWIGPRGRFLNAVPTRDLTARDLQELRAREGITEAEILASGLYEIIEDEEESDGTESVS
jgi:hypothetical protein